MVERRLLKRIETITSKEDTWEIDEDGYV